MKFVRYASDGGPRDGVVVDGVVHEARHAGSTVEVEVGDAVASLDTLRLLCPIVAPSKIVCVGLNYRDHAAESGQDLPQRPLLFGKFPNALAGPGDPIQIPPGTREVDYEAELGVLIGSRAKNVAIAEALDHVYGYTCVNDVSARDLQFADGQWLRGKSLDTFCPVGPYVVTADEIPDPNKLAISCRVNDEVLQSATTADMVFDVPTLISFISAHMTLEPGDLIATGTPPGVGFARTPPIYLRHGDEVAVEIEGIGRLTNPVVSV